jgi:acetolactate synthase-1/2/3 large subunit
MSMSGGELVARMLRIEGVDVVFGIVDGSYFGLCEGLRRQGIRLVSPRHETTAAHMAGAYARLTGRLGVCIASNGPRTSCRGSPSRTARETACSS